MINLLPAYPGLLPYFLIYSGIAALLHTIATYLSGPSTSLKQFSGPSAPPPSTLLAHVYGIKNTYTTLIRLYAAYHIDNPQLYVLAMWSFGGVLSLYVSEMLVWKTVRIQEGLWPLVTAGGGLLWMASQWGFYVVE